MLCITIVLLNKNKSERVYTSINPKCSNEVTTA